MGFASQFANNLSNALAVVNILRSRLASDSDVEVQTDDAALENDAAPYSEVWTIAGVNSRPRDGRERADGTKPAGYAKAIRIQLGDVVYVLGTHDPREMEECAEGELVLYALGKDNATRAMATFKPSGEVLITGTEVNIAASTRVRIGVAGTFKSIAIGDALEVMATVLMGTVINEPGSGAASALQAAIKTALNTAGFMSASQVKSAKHEVEQ